MSKLSDPALSLCSSQVKMTSARSKKSLSAEDILAETCADTLSDELRDVLSESDDDVNESYSDFEHEIARKINCALCTAIQKV
jgi:hypothetical protein